MAGCHSLIPLKAIESDAKSKLIGDPLDQAAFQFSGWVYNKTCDCYEARNVANQTSSNDPIRLWQVKSFPFDPDKRVSTALVVLERADGTLQLLSLTKGSPDTVRDMYLRREDEDFNIAYETQRMEFETRGYRNIALGWMDLSGTNYMRELFPERLEKSAIDNARQRAELFQRSEFETARLEFGGFVQFDASIRGSSRRIIEELNSSGLRSMMLTGDGIGAAVTVANKVRLIRSRKVAILEVTNDSTLQWRFLDLKKRKSGSSGDGSIEPIPFAASSLDDVLKRERLGKLAIATTGSALDVVFANTNDQDMQQFAESLSQVSVIARATPKQKHEFITRLKRYGQTVMMCGKRIWFELMSKGIASVMFSHLFALLL